MKRLSQLFCLIILTTVFSCQQRSENARNSSIVTEGDTTAQREYNAISVDRFFEQVTSSSNLGNIAFLVIPSDTCPVCIDEFKKFIKSSKNPNLKVVLTGISQKRIRLVFGYDVVSKENVIIDPDFLFEKTSRPIDLAQAFYYHNGVRVQEINIFPQNLAEEISKLAVFGL